MDALEIPLALSRYRSMVRLDEPFEQPDPALETERTVLVDELLTHLRSEQAAGAHVRHFALSPSPYDERRRLLHALLTVRGPDPLPSWFQTKLDRLLQGEATERGMVEAGDLARVAQAMPGSSCSAEAQCALWLGDITSLRVDAIVNAANSAMLGCFHPFHACIDNAIHSAAGPRVREDCHAIIERQGFPEATGWAKVTRAYNLPARYILHTVGPMVGKGRDQVLPEHGQQLADCYRSCLDLASQVTDIRSVAFCCISTGVFGFPKERAASIALRTVDRWLETHPGSLDLIVFNVFDRDDLRIYERLLKQGFSEPHPLE